jgi:hypothetical protein
MSVCVFCSLDGGHICAACVQKILLMNEEQLKKAHALAVEQGYTAKAEILESYMEDIVDEGNNTVERGSVRGRPARSLRHEKKPARSSQKRERLPFRQVGS